MSEKWGADWLDQCIDGLRNPEVRAGVAKSLNLKSKNNAI